MALSSEGGTGHLNQSHPALRETRKVPDGGGESSSNVTAENPSGTSPLAPHSHSETSPLKKRLKPSEARTLAASNDLRASQSATAHGPEGRMASKEEEPNAGLTPEDVKAATNQGHESLVIVESEDKRLAKRTAPSCAEGGQIIPSGSVPPGGQKHLVGGRSGMEAGVALEGKLVRTPVNPDVAGKLAARRVVESAEGLSVNAQEAKQHAGSGGPKVENANALGPYLARESLRHSDAAGNPARDGNQMNPDQSDRHPKGVTSHGARGGRNSMGQEAVASQNKKPTLLAPAAPCTPAAMLTSAPPSTPVNAPTPLVSSAPGTAAPTQSQALSPLIYPEGQGSLSTPLALSSERTPGPAGSKGASREMANFPPSCPPPAPCTPAAGVQPDNAKKNLSFTAGVGTSCLKEALSFSGPSATPNLETGRGAQSLEAVAAASAGPTAEQQLLNPGQQQGASNIGGWQVALPGKANETNASVAHLQGGTFKGRQGPALMTGASSPSPSHPEGAKTPATSGALPKSIGTPILSASSPRLVPLAPKPSPSLLPSTPMFMAPASSSLAGPMPPPGQRAAKILGLMGLKVPSSPLSSLTSFLAGPSSSPNTGMFPPGSSVLVSPSARTLPGLAGGPHQSLQQQIQQLAALPKSQSLSAPFCGHRGPAVLQQQGIPQQQAASQQHGQANGLQICEKKGLKRSASAQSLDQPPGKHCDGQNQIQQPQQILQPTCSAAAAAASAARYTDPLVSTMGAFPKLPNFQTDVTNGGLPCPKVQLQLGHQSPNFLSLPPPAYPLAKDGKSPESTSAMEASAPLPSQHSSVSLPVVEQGKACPAVEMKLEHVRGMHCHVSPAPTSSDTGLTQAPLRTLQAHQQQASDQPQEPNLVQIQTDLKSQRRGCLANQEVEGQHGCQHPQSVTFQAGPSGLQPQHVQAVRHQHATESKPHAGELGTETPGHQPCVEGGDKRSLQDKQAQDHQATGSLQAEQGANSYSTSGEQSVATTGGAEGIRIAGAGVLNSQLSTGSVSRRLVDQQEQQQQPSSLLNQHPTWQKQALHIRNKCSFSSTSGSRPLMLLRSGSRKTTLISAPASAPRLGAQSNSSSLPTEMVQGSVGVGLGSAPGTHLAASMRVEMLSRPSEQPEGRDAGATPKFLDREAPGQHVHNRIVVERGQLGESAESGYGGAARTPTVLEGSNAVGASLPLEACSNPAVMPSGSGVSDNSSAQSGPAPSQDRITGPPDFAAASTSIPQGALGCAGPQSPPNFAMRSCRVAGEFPRSNSGGNSTAPFHQSPQPSSHVSASPGRLSAAGTNSVVVASPNTAAYLQLGVPSGMRTPVKGQGIFSDGQLAGGSGGLHAGGSGELVLPNNSIFLTPGRSTLPTAGAASSATPGGPGASGSALNAALPHPPLLLAGPELEHVMAGMELDEGAAWTDSGLVTAEELQLKDLEVLEWQPCAEDPSSLMVPSPASALRRMLKSPGMTTPRRSAGSKPEQGGWSNSLTPKPADAKEQSATKGHRFASACGQLLSAFSPARGVGSDITPKLDRYDGFNFLNASPFAPARLGSGGLQHSGVRRALQQRQVEDEDIVDLECTEDLLELWCPLDDDGFAT